MRKSRVHASVQKRRVAVEKFEPLGEVIGARQFEARATGRQIDNLTFPRKTTSIRLVWFR
jgi:hypothetical protein